MSKAPDLFDASASASKTYTAKDIVVLEGLEAVRRRPGMYIGGTDSHALHHLAAEILDNAMDEAVAGHASRIEIELDDPSVIQIRDNGRGIPVDPHPKFKKVITGYKKFYAHDEKSDAKVGDRVRIEETRPLSKTKRWRLVEVVERGSEVTPVAA